MHIRAGRTFLFFENQKGSLPIFCIFWWGIQIWHYFLSRTTPTYINFIFEKVNFLRKGPKKKFPHHFFSSGPVTIWTCWFEKNTWKIQKISISIFYEFFNLAKNGFDRNNKVKNTLKYFLRKKFKNEFF